MKLTDLMTGIQHVAIPTNDIEKTIAFYEALGFQNIYRTRNEAADEEVVLSANEKPVHRDLSDRKGCFEGRCRGSHCH